jgi:hypothetical protein
MSIAYVIVAVVLTLAVLFVMTLVFVGGYSVGSTSHTAARIQSLRRRAVDAEREVHELAREAFIGITEAVDRRRS